MTRKSITYVSVVVSLLLTACGSSHSSSPLSNASAERVLEKDLSVRPKQEARQESEQENQSAHEDQSSKPLRPAQWPSFQMADIVSDARLGLGGKPLRDVSQTIADIDGDGKNDLIIGDKKLHEMRAFEMNEDGSLSPKGPIVTLDHSPDYMTFADVNGDQKPDLISTSTSSKNIHIFLNRGDGNFDRGDYIWKNINSPIAPVVADLDRDGANDIVVGDSKTGLVAIVYGETNDASPSMPTGEFHSSTDRGGRSYLASSGSLKGIAVGDVNGDGHTDITALNEVMDSNSIVGTPTVTVFLKQNGRNQFSKTSFRLSTSIEPTSLDVMDLNKDGRDEILVSSHSSTSQISILQVVNTNCDCCADCQCQENLAVVKEVQTGTNVEAFVVGDFDGDGLTDFLTDSNITAMTSLISNPLGQPAPATPSSGALSLQEGGHLEPLVIGSNGRLFSLSNIKNRTKLSER